MPPNARLMTTDRHSYNYRDDDSAAPTKSKSAAVVLRKMMLILAHLLH
jgi:hypothetical protein